MRLVAKLTALLMVAICAILAADGYLAVRRQLSLFDAEMTSDVRVLGEALARVLGPLRQTRGDRAVRSVLDEASSGLRGLVLRWRDEPPADLVNGSNGYKVWVPIAGKTAAGVEIAQSPDAEHRYKLATARRVAILLAVTVLICLILALVLGRLVVGEPIRRMVERTREIGRGELAGRVLLAPRRDELGALAKEIDAMADHLLEARQSLAAEHRHRLETEKQLRHADRLATVGTLASGVAHELGTPLNVCSERALMIARGEVEGDEARDNARIIREQTEQMAAIIRDLLGFARRGVAQKVRERPADVARRAVELLASYAAKRRVALTVEGELDEAEAEIDVDQVRQALINLLMNAIQACSPKGHVKLRLERRAATPPPDVEAAAEWLAIDVVDDGSGIDEEMLSHVFEPFFTTKDVGEGTGLGLSVAWGIARGHGGWIEAASRRGETRFSIYLPLGAEA